MVGVLAGLCACLAEAGVSVFVMSSDDTDYVMVKVDRLAVALRALRKAGHQVLEG